MRKLVLILIVLGTEAGIRINIFPWRNKHTVPFGWANVLSIFWSQCSYQSTSIIPHMGANVHINHSL